MTSGTAVDPVPFPEADRIFRECARRAARGGSRVAPMATGLLLAADRLREPMRLALVGQIKRGKSTLVNALLGQQVAATGQLELTFTVSEFRHGDERTVYVHYKDGTVEGPLPPGMLESLTVRNPDALERLRKIRMVEYAMPNGLLRTFRLVDTPGLGSVYQVDAQNSLDYLGVSEDEFAAAFSAAFTDEQERNAARATLAWMGRTARDLHTDSAGEAASANAVVYLFSRGLHPADLSTVVRFLGPAAGSVTPLRSFGVLSRSDEYWPPERGLADGPDPLTFDPMATAKAIADRYLAEPDIGSMFYTILPVAGILGIGAELLTPEELCWLDELSKVEPPVLVRSLRDVGRFARASELRGIALPAAKREQLIARLGGWGTHLACGYLRGQLGEDEIRTRLVDHSGVTRLRDLVRSHFGNMSAIIKLDHGIQDAMAQVGRRRAAIRLAHGQIPPALDDIADRIKRLHLADHGAAELAALSLYYKGELRLTDEQERDLLTVTGYNGVSTAARLALPEGTPPAELLAAAGQHVVTWSAVALDPMLDGVTRSVARTVRASYDILFERVKKNDDTEWSGVTHQP